MLLEEKSFNFSNMNIKITPKEFTLDFFKSVNKLLEKQSNISIEIIKEESISDKKINEFEFKLLVVDIDGVMTDTGIYISDSGNEMKKFNAKDGYGIIQLLQNGYQVAFLSSGKNTHILNSRAKMLGVQHVYLGTWTKLKKLTNVCSKLNISLKNVAYIGDDLNDFDVMQKIGLSACPADAVDEIKQISDIVLTKKGGEGCVREFIDKYLI